MPRRRVVRTVASYALYAAIAMILGTMMALPQAESPQWPGVLEALGR